MGQAFKVEADMAPALQGFRLQRRLILGQSISSQCGVTDRSLEETRCEGRTAAAPAGPCAIQAEEPLCKLSLCWNCTQRVALWDCSGHRPPEPAAEKGFPDGNK